MKYIKVDFSHRFKKDEVIGYGDTSREGNYYIKVFLKNGTNVEVDFGDDSELMGFDGESAKQECFEMLDKIFLKGE
tara:strand:- start:11 stop:238 length:228 start_codon:yes stop_codon:yes gene_type:complete